MIWSSFPILISLCINCSTQRAEAPLGNNPLDGTWAAESITVAGLNVTEVAYQGTIVPLKAKIEGTKVVFSWGKVPDSSAALQINSAKRQFDLRLQSGASFRGIYALDKDVLLLSVSPATSARPTTFNSQEGDVSRAIYVLRRQTHK